MQNTQVTRRPLSGIRVLEVASFVNGPAAGYMLGDLGAEVIKVEDPIRGDAMRGLAVVRGESEAIRGTNRVVAYEFANRNKKSITLNLKSQEGRKVLYKLVSKSDVFITSFSPKVLARLKTDYETLSRHNPLLIYAITSGYGLKGPGIDERSFDSAVQARSGIMYAAGDRDSPEPYQITGAIHDQLGATMLAYGILVALIARERLGVGQVVESSMLASTMHLQTNTLTRLFLLGRAMSRHCRMRAKNPMANHYQCADGEWIMLAEIQPDRYWHEFCEVLGILELENDPRFTTTADRRQNCAQLIPIINERFVTRNRDEWMRIFKEKGCSFTYARVQKYEDLLTDPQVIANEYITELDHPLFGRIKAVNNPLKLSKTPVGPVSAAPEFGQHTEEVLMEIGGYNWEEIEKLKTGGFI